eukprot:13329753-Ditylum_brightwellii.AAC.1
MSSANLPSIIIITLLSIAVFRYAMGVSVVATSCPSFASMTLVSRTAYDNTVGDAASSLEYMSCCFFPSAHPLAYNMPHLFL